MGHYLQPNKNREVGAREYVWERERFDNTLCRINKYIRYKKMVKSTQLGLIHLKLGIKKVL